MATVDSAYTHDEALQWNADVFAALPETWTPAHRREAIAAVEDAARRQMVVPVRYLGFDGDLHEGQIVVDRIVAIGLSGAFERLHEARFPIRLVRPIVAYGFDDDRSMRADNSSGFNPRLTSGRVKRLSNHSLGIAFDINPIENPYVDNPEESPHLWRTEPIGSSYDPQAVGTITRPIAMIFQEYGFDWGGDWRTAKDFQHFDFNIERAVNELEASLRLPLADRATSEEDFNYLVRIKRLRDEGILSR